MLSCTFIPMPREGEESLCEGESLGNEFTSLWGMKAFSEIKTVWLGT